MTLLSYGIRWMSHMSFKSSFFSFHLVISGKGLMFDVHSHAYHDSITMMNHTARRKIIDSLFEMARYNNYKRIRPICYMV